MKKLNEPQAKEEIEDVDVVMVKLICMKCGKQMLPSGPPEFDAESRASIPHSCEDKHTLMVPAPPYPRVGYKPKQQVIVPEKSLLIPRH